MKRAKAKRQLAHPSASVPKRRQELKVIRGGEHKPDNALKLIVGFGVVVALVLSTLIYRSAKGNQQRRDLLTPFSQLHEVYRREGMGGFAVQKEELRSRILQVLQSNADSDTQEVVQNISTYLFPELLSTDDFEKDQAMELWKPLEIAIETAPHSKHSRQLFEEMSANIWNYENPERVSPKISAYAEQVLRIYDAMSFP